MNLLVRDAGAALGALGGFTVAISEHVEAIATSPTKKFAGLSLSELRRANLTPLL